MASRMGSAMTGRITGRMIGGVRQASHLSCPSIVASRDLIVIDARKLGDGGIGVYIENLVGGLLELPPYSSNHFRLALLVKPQALELELVQSWMARGVEVSSEEAKPYSWAEYFLLAFRQRRVLERALLFHSPHYTLPFFLALPKVVTVHDCIHITHPERKSFIKYLGHRLLGRVLISLALHRAQAVITVSESSRGVLLGCFEGWSKTLARRTHVIHNALRANWGRSGAVPSRYDSAGQEKPKRDERIHGETEKQRVMFIGSERSHKGLSELLESWKIVVDDCLCRGVGSPELAIVGSYTQATFDKVRGLGLTDIVTFHGVLEDRELEALTALSSLVVVPSREEGFGLVALEALALGVPVVLTPFAAARELFSDWAILTRDFSPQSIAEAILDFLRHPDDARERAKQGRIVSRLFSREQSARETHRVYMSLITREAGGSSGLLVDKELKPIGVLNRSFVQVGNG